MLDGTRTYNVLRMQFMRFIEQAEKTESQKNFNTFFTTQNHRNQSSETKRYITVLDEGGKLVPVNISQKMPASHTIGGYIPVAEDQGWTLNPGKGHTLNQKQIGWTKTKETFQETTQTVKAITQPQIPSKEISGLQKITSIDDPIKILRDRWKDQGKFSLDHADILPKDILEISNIQEDFGPYGLPIEQKERLKCVMRVGTFEHSILKKNYFFLDEAQDIDFYCNISSYSRKVLRNGE